MVNLLTIWHSLCSLLMYGCMALMTERYEEAETFFEAATCAESKSVISWTMLGKYHTKQKIILVFWLVD